MDIYESLPVLLKVEIEINKIKIRLDDNGLGIFNQHEGSIREITLLGCELNERLINALQESIAEVFEYEVFEENGKTTFHFWGDYGRVDDEILCESLAENFSEYTEKDLTQKGTILHNLYIDLDKRFSKNEALDEKLRSKLNFEISNELERAARKAEFFKDKELST